MVWPIDIKKKYYLAAKGYEINTHKVLVFEMIVYLSSDRRIIHFWHIRFLDHQNFGIYKIVIVKIHNKILFYEHSKRPISDRNDTKVVSS